MNDNSALDRASQLGGWLQEIQYFRAFAIIEVIAVHAALFIRTTNLTLLTPQKEIVIALVAFTSFAIYHFLFISGVVLYNKYDDGFLLPRSLSEFYKKRLSSVVPPYLIWSTFYYFYIYVIAALLFSFFNHSTATYSSLSNLAQLLNGYLTGLVLGIGQLWFVLLIIQFYLLYPLLVRFYNRFARQKNPIYALSFLLLVQIAFTAIFLTPDPIPFRALFVSGIFYFVFGFFVSEHYAAIKLKIAKINLMTISLGVLLATIYYTVVFYHVVLLPDPAASFYVWLFQITGPFYCLLLIGFYLRLSLGLGEARRFFTKYMDKIGESSFGIYLIHMFFIAAFALALGKVGLSYDSLLFYLVLFLLTLISSYLSVEAINRLPFSYIVIGTPRRSIEIDAEN